MTERYVIIGASAAGSSAAETLRRHAPKAQITVVSDEKITYSKPLLSYYLAGHLGEEQLFFRAPDFYERYGIQIIHARAVGLRPEKSIVELSDGQKLQYDKLLLATGAAPRFPKIEGIRREGVFGLRKLEDAKGILARLPSTKRAVVLGGVLWG
jgi:nitrite reductase (NADH) large subunit